ncbi:MucB/RseB C-terminal domain-containing protein [Pseudomonas sp. LRF_L74]|uniref:MucB/RseB C-terminal domain-containing protein n=1 Tax=Pseudomonas sp. LRF_L74 TaxID=3369422 RepID=UPI003F622DD4
MRAVSLVALLGSFLVSPILPASEAQDWLSRSVKSEERSYQGTFVYERNGSFSTHGVWHLGGAEGSRERLLQLDGPLWEVVRVNGRTQCVSGGRVEDMDGVQATAVKALDPLRLAEYYDMSVTGESRVAGRQAVVVELQPRDQYRYGVELQLDKETALPLKSLLLDDKGRLLERFQFISLDLQSSPKADALKPGDGCQAVVATAPVKAVPQTWRAGWLPPGFQLSQVVSRQSPASSEQVASMTYGDGIAQFSVFLEPLHSALIEDARAQLGPTAVISRRMVTVDGDVMVTVIGEIPSGTAERVALSMQGMQASVPADTATR